MSEQQETKSASEAERRIEEARRSGSAKLDLSWLELTALPDAFARLVNLQGLDLSDNLITALPDSIAQLVNLQDLDLSGNPITALPDSIAQLVNLRALLLTGAQITTIQDCVFQLVNLRDLDLSANGITAIPDGIVRLVNLRTLSLAAAQVTAIPYIVSQLTSLRTLDLSFNAITAIPDAISQLVNLQNLDLSANGIAAIPDAISQLVNLQNLDLSANGITAIPDAISQLVNLQNLDLGNNEITAIPNSFAQLVKLENLCLRRNHIAAVPDSIAQLGNLARLELDDNPLPAEVFAALKLGVPSFLRYLRSTAESKVYPRTVKLVLLGEPKSGKTTLLEALKGNPQPCDESRKETLGVDVVNVQKPHPTDHEPMHLSVWDFAGQHIEHATHQFFLTENAIYLILWNARQGADSGKRDLWYWLELLKMRVRNPKFLLVATHIEHTPPDLNLSAIKPSYPGCEGNFPVELCSLKGMASLEAKILELAAGSPSLRAEWPPEWLSVRDEIRRIRKQQPHMTPTAFRSLMKRNRVAGKVAQSDLAGQLHNLGEILYFQERDELSSLVILNPEWVTELIALVVRSKEARDKGGILTKTDLTKLWKQAKLQPRIQQHLVHLMDWFDLTYSTGHKTDLGIVVESLPYSLPEDVEGIALPTDQPKMEMIFRFPSLQRRLPPGIPTWGIARAHRFSKCKPWRDAAAFEDKDSKSQALILASDTTKEIRLSVSADYPPFFFGALDSILRDTFKRYPGAAPERRLPCPCEPACRGTFRFEAVISRRKNGENIVSCDQSGKSVAIDSLLTGFSPPKTEEGIRALHSDLRRRFTEERRSRNEQMEKTHPSVFTLTPSKGFTQLDTWLESITLGEELELTLYCEHDSGWHTISESVYRFIPDQEWFDKLKGSWNKLTSITRYVGPLAKAAGKATKVPWVEAAGLGVEKLPDAPRASAGALSQRIGEKEKPELVDLEIRHLLEQLIDEQDSKRPKTDKKQGGLRPYIIEDGRLLWLCTDHLKQYKKR